MSCIACAKPYSLLRKENGCPGCGFSYCSKCLNNKVFLKKKNIEAKVCAKCKQTADSDEPAKEPIGAPDAYYKRLGMKRTNSQNGNKTTDQGENSKDYEIQQRLLKLREGSVPVSPVTNEEITDRLSKIKGEQPTASDEEIRQRLAALKGIPAVATINKVVLQPRGTRTEQEQADDLLKQYLAQTTLDVQYKEGFDQKLNEMESRLSKLKDGERSAAASVEPAKESDDEEETVKKIIGKYKSKSSESAMALLADDDELPFCELCIEDQPYRRRVRCLGCKCIFCRRCIKHHRIMDDSCNSYYYVTYKPPRK